MVFQTPPSYCWVTNERSDWLLLPVNLYLHLRLSNSEKLSPWDVVWGSLHNSDLIQIFYWISQGLAMIFWLGAKTSLQCLGEGEWAVLQRAGDVAGPVCPSWPQNCFIFSVSLLLKWKARDSLVPSDWETSAFPLMLGAAVGSTLSDPALMRFLSSPEHDQPLPCRARGYSGLLAGQTVQ